jgi:hypothetical protein
MSSQYRAALLTIFADGRSPSLFLGDSVEQTVETFHTTVAEQEAIVTPGKLGLAFDAAGNEFRYLMARVVNGTNAGFVVRRPSGGTSAFLFADSVSAHQFASGFRDCELAVVVQVKGSGAFAAAGFRQDFAGITSESRPHPDYAASASPSWPTNLPGLLPVPDLEPLTAPAGFCPRCIIRPLPSDPAQRVTGVCLACQRVSTLIRERWGV